jgi:hypothetical protein
MLMIADRLHPVDFPTTLGIPLPAGAADAIEAPVTAGVVTLWSPTVHHTATMPQCLPRRPRADWSKPLAYLEIRARPGSERC